MMGETLAFPKSMFSSSSPGHPSFYIGELPFSPSWSQAYSALYRRFLWLCRLAENSVFLNPSPAWKGVKDSWSILSHLFPMVNHFGIANPLPIEDYADHHPRKFLQELLSELDRLELQIFDIFYGSSTKPGSEKSTAAMAEVSAQLGRELANEWLCMHGFRGSISMEELYSTLQISFVPLGLSSQSFLLRRCVSFELHFEATRYGYEFSRSLSIQKRLVAEMEGEAFKGLVETLSPWCRYKRHLENGVCIDTVRRIQESI